MSRSTTGIRELKNNLSRIIRSLRPGQIIAVTDRGRVVAELRAPDANVARSPMLDRYEQLVASGVIRKAKRPRAPRAKWAAGLPVTLPPGTAQRLIDDDRGG